MRYILGYNRLCPGIPIRAWHCCFLLFLTMNELPARSHFEMFGIANKI